MRRSIKDATGHEAIAMISKIIIGKIMIGKIPVAMLITPPYRDKGQEGFHS
jgi:hypothetical protein